MAPSPETANVVLRWTETHEFRVALTTNATDRRQAGMDLIRAAEEAFARSGIFQRYGVILSTVAIEIEGTGMRGRDSLSSL